MMKIKVRNTFSCCYASRIDYSAQIALTSNFQLFSQPSQAIADICDCRYLLALII